MFCVIPQRAVLALMLFTACAISYMLRVNLSINIIAMVKEPKTHNTTFVPTCIAKSVTNVTIEEVSEEKFEKLTMGSDSEGDDGYQRYDWDSQTQGLLIGAYFWGQIISCAPGGLVAERFGATKTVFISTILAALCTFFIPLAAMVDWTVVWLLRFITGIMGGVIYPSLHCLISRWAPPVEKGKFIGALLGGSLGTVLTWPLLGMVIEKWGWPTSFFVPAVVAVLWSGLWFYVVSDSPQENRGISEAERSYIENSLKGLGNVDKVIPPYFQIFTSIPVWAFIIAHFGNAWGLFFLMTSGPKYMSSVLGFKLHSSGFLSALPYLARMLFGFFFGFIGDLIQKNKWMETTTMRKSFITCSHIIPGSLLFLLTAAECDVIWTITLITFSLGVNGASSITNLANSQDLAPAFAGSLYGIANTVGGTTGFISPAIVGYYTKDHNGIDQWRKIFYIGGAVYIVSGLTFCIFGSGENQHFTVDQKPANPEKGQKTGIENNAFESDDNKNNTTQI
ncbi:sialin-like isoform X2 [Coccinella septempunctata]|uniref:sialin-like isoform X2 n=1 Tax=Coccinella septempunctata TaxID=41139 RepID=UPI001D077980|nr:sialin-like isoform X2 [Coccinella septempunctata]